MGGRLRVVGLIVLLGLLGACTGVSDDAFDGPLPELSSDEQAYSDSLEKMLLVGPTELSESSPDEVWAERAECVSVRFVDRMGIDRLERYIPSEILGGQDDQWRDADIRLYDEEVEWLLQVQEACGYDEKRLIAAGLAGGEEDLQACIQDQFDTGLGERMHELQWGGTEQEYERVYPEFFGALEEACGELIND